MSGIGKPDHSLSVANRRVIPAKLLPQFPVVASNRGGEERVISRARPNGVHHGIDGDSTHQHICERF